MRTALTAPALLGLALTAATASAQPGVAPPANPSIPPLYAPPGLPYQQLYCYPPYLPAAPDMCGPGYVCVNNCGMPYGPNYCVRPPFPPFNGMIPGPPPGYFRNYAGTAPGAGCPPGSPGSPGSPWGSPVFPTHPWARSPRDFFMVGD
jgi:hypothetical protein